MSLALNRPSTADLRRSGDPGRSCGPTIMEIISTDDKPKSLPAFSGPAPPMHRIPPPDGSHGPPSVPGMYEQPWRPYPPYEGHTVEQRRTSTAPPPLSSHGYPVIPNRELPQLSPDGPYGRQGSLPGPKHTPTDVHPPFRGPINGTPHEPTPHSAPPEYRSRMSFPPQEPHSNGDPPPPLPPHSIPAAPYSTPVPPMSHTPAPYDSSYFQSQAYGMRQRKAARAQQACDQCRARKAKCDEGRPSCSHCKENNLNCVYKEVPPHKQEKATQLLLDRLQSFQDAILDRFDRLDQLNTEHGNNFNTILAKIEAKSAPKESRKPTVQQLAKKDSLDILQEPKTKDESTATNQEQIPESAEATTEQVVPSGEDGELSIPVEHTTAAHKLLLWPSIRNLLRPREYDEDYVMKLEEQRGLIRVYGRGEGDETSEDNNLSAAPTNLGSSFDENQPYYAASSPSGPWGVGVNQPQVKLANKGLDENGTLTADSDTVRRYHKSYMKHMHQLHPFLDQSDLENKIDQFIRMYCPLKGPTPPSGTPNNHANDLPRGAKRKRSCENLQGAGCEVQSPAEQGSGQRIEKSIYNAIILLVLALGSICEANPVPGPVTDYLVDFRKERIPGPSTRSMLSPTGSDSVPHSQGSGYATNNHTFTSPSLTGNRRNGVEAYPRSQDKNLDVIPGLAFYAYATQILGSLQGANGLPHVQAALLAGLYAGQLARPFQSHGWIYQAARACQVLVRSRRYTQMPDGPVKDLYDFAYWTCLQLESDILAELDLPASGISRSEGRIALPKGRFTLNLPNEISAPSTMMMFFYSAQIHLRKVLNRVHTDLYKVEKQGQTHWSSHVQEILSMNLELWRNSLPSVMKWKDTDPPSEEINVARMRAKYYGARYIIHRPLLYHALHYYGQIDMRALSDGPPTEATTMTSSKSQQVSPSWSHSQSATNMVRLASDMGPSSGFAGTAHRDLPPKLRRACKVCIDSAILSTVAFDGIKGRPVVTNIFGTAHAQFGNMLVLSATYMSSLSELVDRNELERLLKRTINFLLQSRYISPSLRADARILTEIYEKIFGNPSEWRDGND
ncbi:C6 finger domain protein [Aspergillus coremiiformis]|uniref:C6 finger domain protein n=1 Tax=Aspergillus coremiiformis TaxID=138285 RepID=A0A5N6Z5W0_9EURO|nr:C6 finger domain protein [Aspergillus coremiiformis]